MFGRRLQVSVCGLFPLRRLFDSGEALEQQLELNFEGDSCCDLQQQFLSRDPEKEDLQHSSNLYCSFYNIYKLILYLCLL